MIPISRATAIVPSISKVVAAFLDLGFSKAGTPLLIASTPVSAAQPDENARAIRNTSANPTILPCSECIWKPADSARSGFPSTKIRNSPQPSMPAIPMMKA